MSFERLPRVGRFFLTPGKPGNNRHGCLVLLLAPDADGKALDRDELIALLRGRVGQLPAAFRRTLAWSPPLLGGPMLVDDPGFDPAERVVALGSGGPVGKTEFRTLLNAYVAQPLDQSRPLWELAVVPGLRDGRLALIVKLHHAIVEGEGALSSLGALLFARGTARAAATPPAAGTALTMRALVRLRVAEICHAFVHLLGSARVAARPFAVFRKLRETRAAYREQLAGARSPSPLCQPVSGNDAAVARCRDDDIQAIRRAFPRLDASSDDVIMAGIAGGLRRWFAHVGLPAQDQIVQIPVSLARRGLAPSRIFARMPSFMTIRLPLSESDPLARLAQVCAMTARRMPQAAALQRLVAPMTRLPMPLYQRAAGWFYGKAAHFHLASLRGPSATPTILGRPVECAYIATPIRGDLALRLAVLALGGEITIALACDPAIVRDPDMLARGIEASIADLTALLPSGD